MLINLKSLSPALGMISSYLHPFSHYKSQYQQDNVLLRGYPSLTPLFEGNPLTWEHEILSLKTRVLEAAHSEDFAILACTVLIQTTSVTDRQMDGRTDRR